jgi:hypothetical protein
MRLLRCEQLQVAETKAHRQGPVGAGGLAGEVNGGGGLPRSTSLVGTAA